MIWVFAALAAVIVVVIGLVVVGWETARLAGSVRPAVFDVAEAVDFIADRLPARSQARLSHDDVRWVLMADVDLLEESTAGPPDRRYPWSRRPALPDESSTGGAEADRVVAEELAVARILALADGEGRDIADEDVAAVLAGRLGYLQQIGAVGPPA